MKTQSCWAVIPAAGVGQRMGSEIPKQYLALSGRRIIEHTIDRIRSCNAIKGVVVAVSPEDDVWPALFRQLSNQSETGSAARLLDTFGGEQRCHSVLAGIERLLMKTNDHDGADLEDWVLVHDAARPCVRTADIETLIDCVINHSVGGILGAPVRDTLKRCSTSLDIEETVERKQMWHALTPAKCFRFGTLRDALKQCIDEGVLVTDEAQAIELSGLSPCVVESSGDNIKITHPFGFSASRNLFSSAKRTVKN